MVSLRDLAKACNTSVGTVSKALNGRYDVGIETKQRICETARQMGYVTATEKRERKLGNTRKVGVLYESTGEKPDAEMAQIFYYFFSSMDKDGYEIVLPGKRGTNYGSLLDFCKEKRLQGLVIMGNSGSGTAGRQETAGDAEGAVHAETAGDAEGAVHAEIAGDAEGAAHAETAGDAEIAGDAERAAHSESAGDAERAAHAETAGDAERAAHSETAGDAERAVRSETAGDAQKTVHSETDRYTEEAVYPETAGLSDTSGHSGADAYSQAYVETDGKKRKKTSSIIQKEDRLGAILQELSGWDCPILLINHEYPGYSSVCVDHIEGMQQLMLYVCSRGHRRIAFIHGDSEREAEERLEGMRRVAKGLELQIPQEYIRMVPGGDARAAEEVTLQLMELPEPPGCIMYADDLCCMGGIFSLQKIGLQAGKDISVTGYGGPLYTADSHSFITSFQQNLRSVGEIAAQHLIRLIEKPGQTAAENFRVHGSLVPGETLVPAIYAGNAHMCG